MFDNYFKLQEPVHNNEDLYSLLFKQLITEAFIDNEEQFDKILNKLKEKNISLFETLTIHPNYSGSLDGTDIQIERDQSDYNSFLSASTAFIRDEKYISKLVNTLQKDEVKKNIAEMTVFILNLLDNNYKNTFQLILKNELLTEKEIKLKLILPDNLYHYKYRKINFHTLETEFLSENIHELKITKANQHVMANMFRDILKNTSSEQYKKISNNIRNKLDISVIDDYHKKDILKVFLEFGIITDSQSIGDTYLLKDPKIEINSFMALSASAIEKIKQQQVINLEKRLNSIPMEKETVQEKRNKI